MNFRKFLPLAMSLNAIRRVRLILPAAAMIALLPTARADVREAVQRALPATVAVERQHSDLPKVPPPSEKGPGAKDSTAERLRLAVVRRMEQFSGAVVSADGLIVTLITSSPKADYKVTFEDGRSLPARVLVDDHRSGLRLLKVDARDLPFLALAEQEPQIGDKAICTYCTSAKDRAASQGMVAARSRRGVPAANLVQLEIASERMSAGSPVVDESGRLVGIMSHGPRERGFSRIVPRKAIRSLIDARQGDTPVVVQRGFVGISLTQATDAGSSSGSGSGSTGGSGSGTSGSGPDRVLARPLADSPATAAGIQEGDEIVAIDGTQVSSAEDVTALIGEHMPGEKTTITVRRDGKEKPIEVTLGKPAQSPEGTAAMPGALAPIPFRAGGGGGAGVGPAYTRAEPVTPEAIYILGVDGKLYPLAGGAGAKPIENLHDIRTLYNQLPRAARRAARPPVAEQPEPPPRLQRPGPDVEQKPEDVRRTRVRDISRNMEALRQQMDKLTEELRRLEKELAEDKK